MGKTRIVVIWWLVCLLWSSTFLFIKLGLREIPPFTFAWIRLAIAVAVLVPLGVPGGRSHSLSRRDAALLALTGLLLLGVNYDASAMLMMGVAEVPVAIGLGAVVFGERLPSGTLLGGTCVLAAVLAALRGSSRARA